MLLPLGTSGNSPAAKSPYGHRGPPRVVFRLSFQPDAADVLRCGKAAQPCEEFMAQAAAAEGGADIQLLHPQLQPARLVGIFEREQAAARRFAVLLRAGRRAAGCPGGTARRAPRRGRMRGVGAARRPYRKNSASIPRSTARSADVTGRIIDRSSITESLRPAEAGRRQRNLSVSLPALRGSCRTGPPASGRRPQARRWPCRCGRRRRSRHGERAASGSSRSGTRQLRRRGRR